MVGSGGIIPIYGCQRGSSSIPPHLCALLTLIEATPSGGDFESEFEVEEIDAREYNRALQGRRLSR